jgi:hypothetical protein
MSEETEVPELPVTEDGPTEDVEIEITEEDLGESLVDYPDESSDEPEEEEQQEEAEEQQEEEQEEASEEEAPKRKRSPDRRIAELARKAAEAERRAQEMEARLQQAEQLRQQSDMAMMTHYEQRLHGRAEEVKRQLVDAHSIGDSERIVELQGEFYKLQTDLNSIETWKAQQELNAPQPKQAAQAAPQEQERQAAQPTLEPRTADWIQRNSWFQPNSSDFDPEMHEEATIYARRIERRYRAEGRDNEIGGVDYFTEIDRHMQQEFPDAFSERVAPSKKVPPMSRESNVAPVQRSAAPGQPAKNTKVARLTADQRRMAHQLAQSGAIRKPNGGRMTEVEAEKYYAIHMMKQAKGA